MPPCLLLELKPRKALKENIDQLRDGFYAAREYASSMQGWRFEVRTELSLIPALVSNANFLARYHAISLEDQFPDYPKRLFEELSARGRATPEILITACCSTFEEKAMALPYVWAMLAQRIVAFDIYSPIDNRSPIWIPS
ncbi:TnsA endonuclease [Marinobacter manganoxydans MnI7-9]|uniref:TnsA endonuclease n=2 Tax=Marinobacter TaxID=2742 RepID=G6YV09_9GAMM|nr:TnsA endonuclease [Marinobacter manganoxydans MnI7-9]